MPVNNPPPTSAAPPGSATVGTAELDFGAFPGTTDASVAVTGQAGILAGAVVQASIRPVATAEHNADEHRVEEIEVVAGNIVAGTGFTVYGRSAAQTRGRRSHNLYGRFTVGWIWSN